MELNTTNFVEFEMGAPIRSDPDFGRPGKIDLLLGIDIYTKVLLQGRRKGPTGSISPVAFETKFGWKPPGKITNYKLPCICHLW